MNQSPKPTSKTLPLKLILAIGGSLVALLMSACLCIGLISFILPDPDTSDDEGPAPGPGLNNDLPAGTGVYVNGYELTPEEKYAFESITGPIPQGRYWLDNQGYFGREGGPAAGNLYALAEQYSGDGGYYGSAAGGYYGSDGDSAYFYDSSSGCSVMDGELSC